MFILEGGSLIREAFINFFFQQTVFLFRGSILCVHFNFFLFNLLHICISSIGAHALISARPRTSAQPVDHNIKQAPLSISALSFITLCTSRKIGWGVCGTPPETLTLFQTKMCDFPYPISDLIKNLIPYFRPDA